MAHGHHRGPVPAGADTPKVTKESWLKLYNYCKKYLAAIIIALLCAMGGTIMTLVGPDQLAEITDTISQGITPDTEALEEISTEMGKATEKNLTTITTSISKNMASLSDATIMSKKAAALANDKSLSESDKKALTKALSAMSTGATPLDELSSLPQNVQDALLDSIKVQGATISGSEQLATLAVLETLEDADEKEAVSAMSDLPDSVQGALYSDITVRGTLISAADQRQMANAMQGVDTNDGLALKQALNDLPASVVSLISPAIDMDHVLDVTRLLLILFATGWILSTLQGFIMTTVTQKITRSLRSELSQKINRLPMRYYNNHSTGDVLSRVANDVDTIGATLNMSITQVVTAVTQFLGSLLMMTITNVTMTVTGILATILGFGMMFFIMGKSQKYFLQQQQNLGALEGHIEEIYAGHTVVKAYNGEKKATDEFINLNNALKRSGFRAQALSGLMHPLMGFVGNFGYVAVCVVGAYLVMKNQITFGVIVSFMMYIRFFTQPLSQIAQSMQSLQQAGASSYRVFEFLDAEEMEDESAKPKTFTEQAHGDVRFEHVKFGYDENKPIIKDFSLDVKAGQKIAIVGPTGAGKTTIVNLLMRFFEIDGGVISIDGIPTKDMKREDVHAQFCMVLQDTWLFEGTIRENLIYCTENVSDEKMIQACKSVNLDHFIRTLPHGYDTVLNDQVSLSQGQKQQLTIARAIIADKPILILDEATSSIDTRTEQIIQRAMDILMEGRTSFIIAHRLSTIKNADNILVLREGNIVESGNHDELLAKGGFYAELYNSQFEDCIDEVD